MKTNRWLAWAAAVGVGVLASGCDLEDDDTGTNHRPPAGQGGLIVENDVASDLDVFLNGVLQGAVDGYDDRVWDLNPGVYRIVLDEQDGDRSFGSDVDILEGRNTVLDVLVEPGSYSNYRVSIRVEEPD